MSLALSLFPDLDGLDGLISETETVLALYAAVLAILLGFVVAFECVEWFKRRSPVEKILRPARRNLGKGGKGLR